MPPPITRKTISENIPENRAKELLKNTMLELSADTEIFGFGKSKCDWLVEIVIARN